MSVSRETLEKLKRYQALLLEWQGKMNLVSRHTLDTAWERHFEDSLQLLPLIPEGIKTLFDLGSGAGFPGLVFAIARPDVQVHLVESTGKKCTFLETVSRETGAGAIVHNQRIETVSRETKAVPDMISARALANLNALLEYCAPWIKRNPDLILLFPKGQNWAQEVEEARKNWNFTLDTHKSATEEGAMILVLTQVGPRVFA